MTDVAPKIGRPQIVDEDGVPTRQRIIHAALEAIIERGYDAATLGEIARAAEVSPPAIYNHFASKSALFIEAARFALDRVERSEPVRRDPHELLRLDAPPRIKRARRLLVELMTAALRHPDLDAAMAEWQESHVARWVDSGRPEAAARAYYVLVQGLALMDSLHIDEDDADVARYINGMADVIVGQE